VIRDIAVVFLADEELESLRSTVTMMLIRYRQQVAAIVALLVTSCMTQPGTLVIS